MQILPSVSQSIQWYSLLPWYKIVQARDININLALDVDRILLESGYQLFSNIYDGSHQGPFLIFLTMNDIDFTEFSDGSIPQLILCSLPD